MKSKKVEKTESKNDLIKCLENLINKPYKITDTDSATSLIYHAPLKSLEELLLQRSLYKIFDITDLAIKKLIFNKNSENSFLIYNLEDFKRDIVKENEAERRHMEADTEEITDSEDENPTKKSKTEVRVPKTPPRKLKTNPQTTEESKELNCLNFLQNCCKNITTPNEKLENPSANSLLLTTESKSSHI